MEKTIFQTNDCCKKSLLYLRFQIMISLLRHIISSTSIVAATATTIIIITTR